MGALPSQICPIWFCSTGIGERLQHFLPTRLSLLQCNQKLALARGRYKNAAIECTKILRKFRKKQFRTRVQKIKTNSGLFRKFEITEKRRFVNRLSYFMFSKTSSLHISVLEGSTCQQIVKSFTLLDILCQVTEGILAFFIKTLSLFKLDYGNNAEEDQHSW